MASIQSFFTRLSANSGPGTLAGALPIHFSVTSAGPFPLAGHVAVPGSEIGGSLMIEFARLEFGPLAIADVALGPDEDEGTQEVTVTLGAAQLQGHYELFGLESPSIDLDIGGAVRPFPALDALSLGAVAGATDDPPAITEKQYDQIMQANEQKPKLAQSAAGQQMLDAYNQFNDVYHDAFKSNAYLRQHWSANGAVAEMSDHTSDALDQGTVVNPPDKTFGTSGVNYNMNAFQQKLNVWAACVNSNPDAAAAALKFGTTVEGTGNSKTNVNPMTGDDVYSTVNETKPAPLVMLLASPEEHPLHAPLLSIVQNSHDERHLDMLAARGMDLNDDEVQALQEIYAESLRVRDPAARLTIAAGNCAVAVGRTAYRFRLTRQANGAITVKLVQSTLSLDGLDYGGAQWPGEAGQVARERLESAAFLRGIIEDRINSQLTRLVRGLAAHPA
ncbi:MAG: hypothetical protein ACK4K7_10780 [Allosphingosinicella sp.]|uniref:hypothetical protein n=1 Tax=Allosphingosinicella sp. TaxID=2823234 RepID=UPI003951C0EC